MTFDEFKIVAKSIRSLYPKDNVLPDIDSVKIFYAMLMDIPYDTLVSALKRYVMTNKYPPTVADLRATAAEATRPVSEDWSAAWEKVRKAIRYFGYYRENEALESLDEPIRTIVKRLGYQELCLTDNMAVDRANFRKIYEQMQAQENERAKLPGSLTVGIGVQNDTDKRRGITVKGQ